MTLNEHLTGVAAAIRQKTGETGAIPAAQFASKIQAIETGVPIPEGGQSLHSQTNKQTGDRILTFTFDKLSNISIANISVYVKTWSGGVSDRFQLRYINGEVIKDHVPTGTDYSYLNLTVSGNVMKFESDFKSQTSTNPVFAYAMGDLA